MSSNKKKSKPWNETIIREKYDVFITNDHERTEELIPPLSVYIGAGFAAEIKHFHIESITEKVFSTEPSSDKSFSFKTEIHKPVAYSILLIDDNKNVVFHKFYCGLDAISNLILCLQNISKAVLKYMKRNIPMDKDGIVSEDKCHLCKQEFPRGCISVTNHDHFSGKVLGKACQGYVVLLAEVFENFRTLSMNYFELDPVHFYTTPSLTWSAGIKTTKVTLELLTDIDMYLMLESGIRGDTDSLCLEVWTEDVYYDLAKKFENVLDFSNYDVSHKYYSEKYKALLGYLKDETKGVPIQEFCALRPKMYSYVFGNENKKTAKGTKKTVVQNVLKHQLYLDILERDELMKNKQTSIISKNHIVSTIKQNKTSLCSFYDKMYMCNKVQCLAYGNVSIKT
ncbi:uncharacterized protein CDAR_33571 [Caerostris darwini]|uniref:Uncharacterized protein n=1 Tax=Caerostris darwini TaxID=1538125 RepID=A0AAV4S4P8_9ARAC|nr:uncharacterized protein CDAR_33571 [Caerostris darwini]